MMEVTLYIREHREAKGMNCEDLAAASGVCVTNLYAHERNAAWPSRISFARYCRALGVEPGELFSKPKGV